MIEVSLILHEKFISYFPEKVYGNTSVWERIKLAGADRYYRVEYGDNRDREEGMDKNDRRRRAIGSVTDPDIIMYQTPTSIVNTPYFDAILDVFVSSDSEAENQLYEELKDNM